MKIQTFIITAVIVLGGLFILSSMKKEKRNKYEKHVREILDANNCYVFSPDILDRCYKNKVEPWLCADEIMTLSEKLGHRTARTMTRRFTDTINWG